MSLGSRPEEGPVTKETVKATSTAVLVRCTDPDELSERSAVAGFLAGSTGSTRVSYTTDLRLFAEWCAGDGVRLLAVKRAHVELFRPSHGSQRADAFDGRPTAVHTGELLPLLPRRRLAAAEPGSQRTSPEPRTAPSTSRASMASDLDGETDDARNSSAAGPRTNLPALRHSTFDTPGNRVRAYPTA
jgi:hypothetical protein